jgi:fructuronate reductase
MATQTMARLSQATVAGARADKRPGYDRSAPPTVTHVGLGAFARAHVAVFADDLLTLGHAASIRAVSLHHAHVAEQLAPQDGYYSVAVREPEAPPHLRVVGAITSASTGAEAALAALTAPTTRLVTLTITEKGYDADPGGDPAHPSSAAGLLALALQHWRRTGGGPPVIAPLDNVGDNGRLLRTRVVEAAAAIDPGLPAWVEDAVAFPNSVVDRMVPATTPEDLDDISSRLGLVDLGAVATEAHRSWVLADVAGMGPWGEAGVELVPDTTPYEQRKLWLLNGPHSALAYCGLLAGCSSIAEAGAHRVVSAFVRSLVDDVLEVERLPERLGTSAFAADALRRFRNPHLGHRCAQVGADGSRKLAPRFGAVVTARFEAGLDVSRFAVVVALWIGAVAGIPLGGRELGAPDDPDAARIRSRRDAGPDAVVEAALDRRFPLAFSAAVVRALRGLMAEGLDLLERHA